MVGMQKDQSRKKSRRYKKIWFVSTSHHLDSIYNGIIFKKQSNDKAHQRAQNIEENEQLYGASGAAKVRRSL